nr:Sharpin like [Ipomoea batatas]
MAAESTSSSSNLRITVQKNVSDAQLSELGIKSWPKWGCSPGKYQLKFDAEETCYLLRGKVKVYPKNTTSSETVEFGAGDLTKPPPPPAAEPWLTPFGLFKIVIIVSISAMAGKAMRTHAATKPHTTAAHGSTTEQPLVMAANPPRRPLQTSVRFQLPIRTFFPNSVVSAAVQPESVVVTAVLPTALHCP